MPRTSSPLGALLRSKHSTREEPIGLPAFKTQLNMAHRKAGSWKAAAANLGVSESTLRSWRNGSHRPSTGKRATVEEYTRGQRKTSTRRVIEQMDPAHLELAFTYNKSHATLTANNLRLRPGTMPKVFRALLGGDEQGAAAAFIAGIGDDWYKARLAEHEVQQKNAKPAGGRRPGSDGGTGGAGGGRGRGGPGGEDEDDQDEGAEDYDLDDLYEQIVDEHEEPDYDMGVS